MANPLISNYDTSKTFVWNLRTSTANYTNSTYDTVTLLAGTLLGRIAVSGLVVPLTSGASDGSQVPLGILIETTEIEAGDTISLTFAVEGDVVEDKILLQGSDTLNTVIGGRRLRDSIGADTVGIKIQPSTDLTNYDNQ